jgi:N-methylhydantoinase A
MRLRTDAACVAIRRVSKPLGVSDVAAALAIVEIAVLNMSLAVRQVSVARGYDPRDFVLIAFGGAGPLHAAAVARALHIPTVVVPVHPGQFSAGGMLMADRRHDFVRTYYRPLERADFDALARIADELDAVARDRLREGRAGDGPLALRYSLDIRYAGQDFSMPVPIEVEQLARSDRDGVARAFNALHERAFGYSDAGQPLEIVSLRLAATAQRAVPGSLRPRTDAAPPAGARGATTRDVWFDAKQPIRCPIYDRDDLAPAEHVSGPAIVREYASTTLVGPTDRLEVAATGELVITIGAPS